MMVGEFCHGLRVSESVKYEPRAVGEDGLGSDAGDGLDRGLAAGGAAACGTFRPLSWSSWLPMTRKAPSIVSGPMRCPSNDCVLGMIVPWMLISANSSSWLATGTIGILI